MTSSRSRTQNDLVELRAPSERERGSELEQREVRSEDPSLSPETNARLTEELRDVVGADTVTVPKDRPHASRGEHPEQHGFAAYMNIHRFQLLRSTAIMLTFGGIVALITRTWWVLPLTAGIHALGTMLVTMTIIRMTTISEHPAPDVGAALAEEGISNPDEHFSRMVEEFRAEPEHGASEVVSPGHNVRTGEAIDDPAAAAAEQSSAMTPTAGASQPGGELGTPDYLMWATTVSLLVLSVVLPAVMGGRWLWLLTAVMVPLLFGWGVLQVLLARGVDLVHIEGRRGPLVGIVACTVLAVVAFCAVVAVAFAH
jgi:hypothetical protein